MMRIALAAIAALSLLGTGAIAQGVSFGGEADMGVIYSGAKEDDGGNTSMESSIMWVSNFDIAMSASGTTDGGLTFGAAAKVKGGNGGSSVGASNVYIGGESWKIAIGDLDPASDKGKSLGDIGYDGLGVDDVAEFIGGTQADVEVSFSLGAASLAITAGQLAGSPREMTSAAVEGSDRVPMKTHIYAVTPIGDFSATPAPEDRGMRLLGTIEDDGTFDITLPGSDGDLGTDDDVTNTFYLNDGVVTKVNGEARDTEENEETDDAAAAVADLGLESTERLTQSVEAEVSAVDAVDAVYKAATKEETQWAAGVSFDIGSTTLGIGMDSEKLMQASVGADLGAFTGSLFYSRQKMDDDSKKTGMGVEIGVSAGANTTINTVYAQGKTENGDTSEPLAKIFTDSMKNAGIAA